MNVNQIIGNILGAGVIGAAGAGRVSDRPGAGDTGRRGRQHGGRR